MDFVERVQTREDPLMSGFPFTPSENISSSTTTTALPVEAKVDVETDTTSSTITTTPIPPAPSRGHNSQRQLGITEVSFSMAVTGTSTKTDNKGKMFTVYNTKVSALGIRWVVPKRFSELELLNDALRKRYPQSRLPKFPSKGGLGGLFRRLDDSTIEKRRSDLQTYLDGALANPTVYKSQLLRLFFEIPRGVAQAHREADQRALVSRAEQMSTVDGESVSSSEGSSNQMGSYGGGSGNYGIGEVKGAGKGAGKGKGKGARNRKRSSGNSSSSSVPKQIVLFANQTHPELSFDVQGMRLSIKKGDLAKVQQILEADKKLGRYVSSAGQSMLHLACIFSHTDIAMLLLDVGADPELRNAHGETAFDLSPPALAQKMLQFIADWESQEFL
jgi:hypothetical protein